MQSYCLHTHRAEREILQHCSRKARGDPFSNLRGSLLFLKMHSGNLRPQKPTSPKPRLHLKWTNECEKRPEAAFSSDALQRVYCYAILVHYYYVPQLPSFAAFSYGLDLASVARIPVLLLLLHRYHY